MGNRHHYRRLRFVVAAILTGIVSVFASSQIASAQTRIISLSGDLDFGSIPLGTSAQRTLIISNLGDSVLTISNLYYPPEPVLIRVDFAGNFSGPIEPGGAEFVPITFTPIGTAINGGTNDLNFQGYLFVDSDATGGSNSILMTGVGTWPPLTSSLNLDFGPVPIGTTTGQILTLTNIGDTPVTVSNVSFPGGFMGGFTGTIAPGASENFSVLFNPAAVTNYSGIISISSDATDPVLVLLTPSGNITNSPGGFNAFYVSGSGAYPSGEFEGLFMPTNNAAFDNSGYFAADCTTNGKYRATITLAGKRYPFSAQVSSSATVSATIVRKKLPPLNVSLQFGGFSRGWTGTVGDGTWIARLSSEPATLISKHSLRAVPAGKYTIDIAGSTNALVAPTASGTGTITVRFTDATHVAGVLGDGARYSQSTILCDPNHIPFYASLYGNRGAILGWIAFVQPSLPPPPLSTLPAPVTTPPGGVIIIRQQPPVYSLPPTNEPLPIIQPLTETSLRTVGTLNWFKPAGIDRDYPDGFSFQTTVTGSVP